MPKLRVFVSALVSEVLERNPLREGNQMEEVCRIVADTFTLNEFQYNPFKCLSDVVLFKVLWKMVLF